MLSPCGGVDGLTGTRYDRRRRMSLRIEPMSIHRIHRRGSRPAVIDGSKLVTVMTGRLLMGGLLLSRGHMPLSYYRLFLGGGPG